VVVVRGGGGSSFCLYARFSNTISNTTPPSTNLQAHADTLTTGFYALLLSTVCLALSIFAWMVRLSFSSFLPSPLLSPLVQRLMRSFLRKLITLYSFTNRAFRFRLLRPSAAHRQRCPLSTAPTSAAVPPRPSPASAAPAPAVVLTPLSASNSTEDSACKIARSITPSFAGEGCTA